MKKALITGITGQDGSYLAEFLLEKGYEVHGIVRRASISNTARIDHLMGKIKLHDGDLSDSSGLFRIVGEIKPDTTSSQSNLTGNKVLATALRLMVEQNTVDSEHIVSVTIFFHNPEAVLLGNCVRRIRVERRCFTLRNFLDLTIQFRSRCLIHLAAFSQTTNTDSLQNTQNTQSVHITGIFRCIKRNLHMALCSQIVDFIAEGLQDHLELGNMDSLRDWGYAKDYVECMWLIMQQEKPEDFVIATGVQHTVRDFTEKAFAANGINIRWKGTGLEEKGYDAETGKMLVCVNPQWFRPTDVDNLWGDPTKAKTVLGWNPQKTSYEQLVEIMAKHDRKLAKREKAMREAE